MSSSVLFKLFEYIILDKIDKYFNINDRQHGYQNGYSTATAFYAFKETILSYFNENTPVYAAFIDLSKAFDCVNHSILFKQLFDKGFPNVFIKLLYHWYRNQSVNISFNSCQSTSWDVNNGVRQGGILSPYLFNFYINNLMNNISSMNVGCNLGILKSNIIAYADDIVLLSPSLGGLQRLVNCFVEGINEIDLRMNIEKTVCIKFTNKKYFSNVNCSIKCSNYFLKFVSETKYLGYFITYNLCNNNDIIHNRNTFYKQFNVVIRKFSNVKLNVLVNLFNTYCLQFYGANLWFRNFGCSLSLHQLAVGYHKAIKKILKVPYGASNHDCCEIVNLLTFNHFLNFIRLKFIFRIFYRPCKFTFKINSFLKFKSCYLDKFQNVFKSLYDVDDILYNDLNALITRIFYVDRRERRSNNVSIA